MLALHHGNQLVALGGRTSLSGIAQLIGLARRSAEQHARVLVDHLAVDIQNLDGQSFVHLLQIGAEVSLQSVGQRQVDISRECADTRFGHGVVVEALALELHRARFAPCALRVAAAPPQRMNASLHIADVDVHRARSRGKRPRLEVICLFVEPIHIARNGSLFHRLFAFHDEVFGHLTAPHASIVLHAHGERVQSLLQSFDVNDVYRVLLIQSHHSIHIAVNPVLVLNNLLVLNADFCIRLNEVLGHLRAPHSSVVLYAHGE